jgi:hypothetical protein
MDPPWKHEKTSDYKRWFVNNKCLRINRPRTGLWDEVLVQDTFWEFDAKAILKLRAYQELDDRSAWHFDKKGMFSVKSAYKLVVQKRETEQGRDTSGSTGAASQDNMFRWDKI